MKYNVVSVGSAERDERGGDNGQAGPALAAQPQLVHPGDVRYVRRRAVRGPGLALQPAEERKPLTACAPPTHRQI